MKLGGYEKRRDEPDGLEFPPAFEISDAFRARGPKRTRVDRKELIT